MKQFKISIMKRITFIAISLVLIMGVSCSSPNKEKNAATKTVEKGIEPAVAEASPGQKLYADKGCVACHLLNSKLVGPSIKDIAAAYAENKSGLIAFLKGEGKPIVDSDPVQAAVMHPQIAITKALPANELDAMVNYILSAK
ncbi:MAG: c-type cytochrome [Bacteroidota bacterium]|nr:c-type cytochrome [Bacteroidota bacterium]